MPFTSCLQYIQLNQNLEFLVLPFFFALIDEILALGFIVVNFNIVINLSEKPNFSLEDLLVLTLSIDAVEARGEWDPSVLVWLF